MFKKIKILFEPEERSTEDIITCAVHHERKLLNYADGFYICYEILSKSGRGVTIDEVCFCKAKYKKYAIFNMTDGEVKLKDTPEPNIVTLPVLKRKNEVYNAIVDAINKKKK